MIFLPCFSIILRGKWQPPTTLCLPLSGAPYWWFCASIELIITNLLTWTLDTIRRLKHTNERYTECIVITITSDNRLCLPTKIVIQFRVDAWSTSPLAQTTTWSTSQSTPRPLLALLTVTSTMFLLQILLKHESNSVETR